MPLEKYDEDKCLKLTHRQVNRIIDIVEEWMYIKEDAVFPNTLTFNSCDPSHSSLLYRMLSDLKPIDYKPPLSMSRPDPWIAEWGGNVIFSPSFLEMKTPMVVINQCGEWKLVLDNGDGTYVVQWPPSDRLYILIPRDGSDSIYNYRLIPIEMFRGYDEEPRT